MASEAKMRRENYDPRFIKRAAQGIRVDVSKNDNGTFTAEVKSHDVKVEGPTESEAARRAERAVMEKVSKDGGASIQQKMV